MTATTTNESLEARTVPPSAALGRRSIDLHPFHLLYPVAAIAALVLAMHPVIDPDVYWHVRLGGEMLQTHTIAGHAASWSLVPGVGHWISSEWLAEIMLHGFVAWFGWQGMLVYQGLVAAAFFIAVAFALPKGPDPRMRAVIFAVTVIFLAPLIQARPQSLSLVLLVYLAAVCRTLLLDRRLPRVVPFLALVWLWAQLHGLWILAPVLLAVAAAAPLLDDRTRPNRQVAKRGAALAAGALALGLVNPVGLRSLTLPFTLHDATQTISEWQPTTFIPYFTWGVLILVALQVFAWSRSATRVPIAEMLWTAGVGGFSLLAYRNIAVSTLLLAPVVVTRVSATRAPSSTSARERRALAAALAALVVAAVGIDAVTSAFGRAIPKTAPTTLAATLNDGKPHRVLDAYNTGGVVLAFAGRQTRVGVDGRADYYGASYISRYQDMLAMKSGWQKLFNRIAPDAAIINRDGPLVQWLTDHGWRTAGRQESYLLLLAPAGGSTVAQ